MNKALAFILSSLLMSLSAQGLVAQSLPENHAVNGGVTIIPIDLKKKPEAYFNGQRIAVVESEAPNQWLLLVGIPLNNDKEIQNIIIKRPLSAKVPFHISKKRYKTQSLSIKNTRKVDPYAGDRDRISMEQAKLKAIYTQRSAQNPFDEGFIAPSHGPISSLFGLNRIYNGKARAPHSGLDIASADGSDVRAASSGRVVEAKDYFFTGNTVIIDHGQGVFSLYAHLKDYKVKKGQAIRQGEVLGRVGKTGRVTGPHLHWTMIMNGYLVDPLLFVPASQVMRKQG